MVGEVMLMYDGDDSGRNECRSSGRGGCTPVGGEREKRTTVGEEFENARHVFGEMPHRDKVDPIETEMVTVGISGNLPAMSMADVGPTTMISKFIWGWTHRVHRAAML